MRIALKKEIFDMLKKEGIWMLALFGLFLLIFKIAFFNESLMDIAKISVSIFWLYVIPGCAIMFHWHEKIGFIERAVAGTLIAAGLTGILSYYFGLAGINIKFHAVILPLIIILASLGIFLKNNKGSA